MSIIHPTFGSFMILQEIGSGSYSHVYRCTHNELNVPVAIKVLDEDMGEISNVKRAFDIASRFSHPLISEEYDMFRFENKYCILSEIVEGNTLLDFANNFGPLFEIDIQTIIGQLICAIDYLHNTVHVIHRDLKCENILIDIYKNVRLIDFGFACSTVDSLHSTICGSPAYIAPEMILKHPYDYSVDIWSLGIILYAITYGYLPFEDQNMTATINKIVNEDLVLPGTASPALEDLISRMLEKDPKKRITLKEIMAHDFFKSDEFGRTYVFDPSSFIKINKDLKPIINKCLSLNTGIPEEEVMKLIEEDCSLRRDKLATFIKIMRKQLVSCKIGGFGRSFLRPNAQKPCRHSNTLQPDDKNNPFQLVFDQKLKLEPLEYKATTDKLPKLQKIGGFVNSHCDLSSFKQRRMLNPRFLNVFQ